jgi:hypothetical protein
MDVLIVTTESHRKLAGEYFLPSLPSASDVNILERKLDVSGDGAYESEAWQTGVTAKLHWAIEYIDTHGPDAVFCLSDVDIQFFDGFSAEGLRSTLDAAGTDVLFQKESRDPASHEVNTGFYVARTTPWVRDLLGRAADLCEGAQVKNDQIAVNELLSGDDLGVHWGFLPFAYYARSQGFPPRDQIVLHHANFSGSVPEKSAALKRVRAYVTGNRFDRVVAVGREGVDYTRTGKLRMTLRTKLRR